MEQQKWAVARNNGTIKICPECGGEFIKDSKFCSRKCYLQFVKKPQKRTVNTVRMKCMVCEKEFQCPVTNTTFPVCSDSCVEEHKKKIKQEREKIEAKKKQEREEKKKAQQQKFIEENGLCSICKTSYMDCERMQTNFHISPKGASFQNGKVMRCPKFTN